MSSLARTTAITATTQKYNLWHCEKCRTNWDPTNNDWQAFLRHTDSTGNRCREVLSQDKIITNGYSNNTLVCVLRL